jgi:hypothetical protein
MKYFNVLFSRLVLFLIYCFLISMNSFCHAESLTIKLDAGEYSVNFSGADGDCIAAPQFGMVNIPGKPKMPMKTFYIATPPDAEVSKVWFTGAPKQLDGVYNIQPAKLQLPAGDITKEEYEAAKIEYNENFKATYDLDDPYPAQSATYIGGGGYRKYKFIRVTYSPWQYYPKTMRVAFTPEINVNIEYERAAKLDASVNLSDTVGEDTASEIIYNYYDAKEWYPVQPKALGSTDYTYLIMCTDATEDDIQTLVNWKESIGYRVKVFTKEWLEANSAYPSYELERKIRYYLRDNYLSWGAQYFLIVADTDVIPMRYCISGSDGSRDAHTDTYYAELTSLDSASWDHDWDGNYGEYGDDSIDWAMELKVGRIPDNDPVVIQAICEKIRDYELNSGAWKKRGLFLGAFWVFGNEDRGGAIRTDSAEVMVEMLGDLTWTGWTNHTMYEQGGIDPSNYTSTWDLNDANVVAQWSTQQYGLVNLSGHGNDTGIYRKYWSFDDGDNVPETANSEVLEERYFRRQDIPSLDDSHPSIAFFGSCSCGDSQVSNSVGKELLHDGAVATISAAGTVVYVENWNDEGDGNISTFEYLWNKRHVNDGQNIGTALMNTKTTYAASYTSSNGDQQILHNMNLYGDPSLLREGVSTLPDLEAYVPGGWAYPIVVRPAADATPTYCPTPDTLEGNTASTYFNYSIENTGNFTAYDVTTGIYVDNELFRSSTYTWVDPAQHREGMNIGPVTIKGGRHSVKAFYDHEDEITEISENNTVSRQYVWSPYELVNQTPVLRTDPPENGTSAFYNCDGFTFNLPTSNYWAAVGIIHASESDNYDVRLYEDYDSTINGFDTYHKWSQMPNGATDFVIVNRNQTASAGPYYAGVIRNPGDNADPLQGFYIQLACSGTTMLSRTALNGPFTIHGTDAVDMHEVYLPAGTWKLRIDNTLGNADLSMTIYDAAGSYFTRNEFLAGCVADAGETDEFTVTIPTTSYYGVAVWKSSSDDLFYSSTYYIAIGNDFNPPTPNPMTWYWEPYAVSSTSISMTSSTASDTSGVKYYFDYQSGTGTGGNDSGWQTSKDYTDSGLEPNDEYGYIVKARDNSVFNNTGSPSALVTVATFIETPTGIDFGTISTGSIQVKSESTPSHLDIGSSGLQLQNYTTSENSSWMHVNAWLNFSGLSPNTQYGFRARACNRDGWTTGYCTTEYKYTLAMMPGADAFTGVTTSIVTAHWTHNGNPAGTQYYCENITTGQNSGWITDLQWKNTGLSPETLYQYRVKGRNGDGVETGWRSLGSVRTLFVDSDNDGLPDTWENTYFGNLSQNGLNDYDGDDSSNIDEYEAGTLPNDKTSFFAIVDIRRNPDQTISIFCKCVSGKEYCVWYSDDNMGSGMTWHIAQDNLIASATTTYEWVDNGQNTGSPPSAVPHRYYKVMVYGPYD